MANKTHKNFELSDNFELTVFELTVSDLYNAQWIHNVFSTVSIEYSSLYLGILISLLSRPINVLFLEYNCKGSLAPTYIYVCIKLKSYLNPIAKK